MVRGMRVTGFIAMAMMPTMAGGPEKDGPLRGHAPCDAKTCPNRCPAFETPMGKQAMISQGDSQHGDQVKYHAKSQIEGGKSSIPEYESCNNQGEPRDKNGDDGSNTFGPFR